MPARTPKGADQEQPAAPAQPNRTDGAQFSVRLPDELRQQVKDYAESQERSEKWVAIQALRLFLSDPTLTADGLAQLRQDLANAQRQVERLTSQLNAADARAIRLELENKALRRADRPKGLLSRVIRPDAGR